MRTSYHQTRLEIAIIDSGTEVLSNLSINHSKRDDHVFLNFTIIFIDLAREYNKTNDDETSPTECPVM